MERLGSNHALVGQLWEQLKKGGSKDKECPSKIVLTSGFGILYAKQGTSEEILEWMEDNEYTEMEGKTYRVDKYNGKHLPDVMSTFIAAAYWLRYVLYIYTYTTHTHTHTYSFSFIIRPLEYLHPNPHLNF